MSVPVRAAVLALAAALAPAGAAPARFATARAPAPVFSGLGFFLAVTEPAVRPAALVARGRDIEFVALPGTPFTVEETLLVGGMTVYRVFTRDYPHGPAGSYVDARFLRLEEEEPAARRDGFPARETIIEALLAARGTPYVWGGNLRTGIPAGPFIYRPPAGRAAWTETERRLLGFRGCDCSGLLYEATGGRTPRNTRELLSFGEPVPVAGLPVPAIAARLRPLDIIVWPGHVIVVLDDRNVIESRVVYRRAGRLVPGYVKVRDTRAVLEETVALHDPADAYPDPPPTRRKPFVVRRWYEVGGRQCRAQSAECSVPARQIH